MRALPMVDGRLAGETLPAFGLRVLTFVMVSGVTATVSDDGLHAADHAYPIAIARADVLPAVVDALSAARHQILAALRARAVEGSMVARVTEPSDDVPRGTATLPAVGRPDPKPLAPAGMWPNDVEAERVAARRPVAAFEF